MNRARTLVHKKTIKYTFENIFVKQIKTLHLKTYKKIKHKFITVIMFIELNFSL